MKAVYTEAFDPDSEIRLDQILVDILKGIAISEDQPLAAAAKRRLKASKQLPFIGIRTKTSAKN